MYGLPGAVATANGEFVSGNFFKTFGVAAWRGRLFNPRVALSAE